MKNPGNVSCRAVKSHYVDWACVTVLSSCATNTNLFTASPHNLGTNSRGENVSVIWMILNEREEMGKWTIWLECDQSFMQARQTMYVKRQYQIAIQGLLTIIFNEPFTHIVIFMNNLNTFSSKIKSGFRVRVKYWDGINFAMLTNAYMI